MIAAATPLRRTEHSAWHHGITANLVSARPGSRLLAAAADPQQVGSRLGAPYGSPGRETPGLAALYQRRSEVVRTGLPSGRRLQPALANRGVPPDVEKRRLRCRDHSAPCRHASREMGYHLGHRGPANRTSQVSLSQPARPARQRRALSRRDPDALALKRAKKKRNETIPDATPTIAQATRWIAELDGYTGKSSGGPPGSITIRRGLDEILAGARVLEALESQNKM